MAKIDGRIQESEINMATRVMDHFNLQAAHKRLAISLFNQGKNRIFNLDAVLNRFYKLSSHRVSVLHLFMEIQLKLAAADGVINSKEKAILQRMCKRLDIPGSVFQRIERRIFSGQTETAAPLQSAKPIGLSEACTLLGVSRWSKQQEVKLAYRRLMSQYHPDKLVAKQSSSQELQQATDKVQQIRTAYEIICKIKKFR